MKINLNEKEPWGVPKILVLPIDTVARNIDENGCIKSRTRERTCKIVEIERLNDEYCAVMLVVPLEKNTNKDEDERIDDGRRKAERSKTQADENNPVGVPSQVCSECAIALGYTPAFKVAGVWMGECAICHERKPCTDLLHDWVNYRRAEDAAACLVDCSPDDWRVDDACRPSPRGRRRVLRSVGLLTVCSSRSALPTSLNDFSEYIVSFLSSLVNPARFICRTKDSASSSGGFL